MGQSLNYSVPQFPLYTSQTFEDETSENALDVSEVGLLKEQRKDSGKEEAEVGARPVHRGPYRPRQS